VRAFGRGLASPARSVLARGSYCAMSNRERAPCTCVCAGKEKRSERCAGRLWVGLEEMARASAGLVQVSDQKLGSAKPGIGFDKVSESSACVRESLLEH
jgi:hypothetical protein